LQVELLSSREEAAIRGAFRQTLVRSAPSLAEQGDRLLDRLPPQRWLLEWGLPLWLGESFGLNEEVALTLAVCNLLGLAYVRVQDDLTDGEIEAADRPQAMALATVAFQAAILSFARLFGGDERFWTALEQRLGQWAQALPAPPDLAPGFSAHPHRPSLRRLAHAGAPAHIGLVAACLLGRRDDLLPQLSAALDDWLLASVLLDHARDWMPDLDAGRYNAFVAHSTSLAQAPAHHQAIRRQMQEMILLGDGGRPYFDLVLRLLHEAQAAARPAGCARLNAYLDWFVAQTTTELNNHRQQTADQLHRATKLLFGNI